ncbi:hypothetical protein DES53_10944 [Roseimicrobium gellanilyticum]|uniref:Uncharacterized protein n=1 Tax=Roseimicrobium gellanilyticum TaxID=748857 RepID=A0A366HBI0_9BACT|nr:hypothetical protein DES53_10944 [Roseimicrobium gellanilyticum]
MGYHMGGGAVLGLSDPTVTAAGSDARFVTFKCESNTGPVRFYYIEKKPGEEGEVSGPFSADEYAQVENAKMLPPHSWTARP